MEAGTGIVPALATPSFLRLPHSLGLVRTRGGRLVAASAAGLYLFAALTISKMLEFGPTSYSSTQVLYLVNGPWWSSPAYVIIAPNALLYLPLFTIASMALVAAGIGIGMGASVMLAVRLFRWNRRRASSPGAIGSLAGLTPALLALLTLGACCSTTAATTASIGTIAAATGSDPDQLLNYPWFLAVFQLAVLYVALLAQERLVAVYVTVTGESSGAVVGRPRGRAAAVAVGRIGARIWVAAAGMAWVLGVVAAGTAVGPFGASAIVWAGWLALYIAPGTTVLGIALRPDLAAALATHPRGVLVRAAGVGLGLLVLIAPWTTPVPPGTPAPFGPGLLVPRLLLEVVPLAAGLFATAVWPAALAPARVASVSTAGPELPSDRSAWSPASNAASAAIRDDA